MTTPERDAHRDQLLEELRHAIDEMGWRNLRTAEKMLTPFHLTFMQAFVMTVLDRNGPQLEMLQIAATTHLPASTVSSIMDRLVARGLVERTPKPEDRRRITGSLTDEGKRIVAELEERQASHARAMLSHVATEDLEAISRVLSKLLAMGDEVRDDDT